MNLSEAFTQIGQWFREHALRLLPSGGTAGQVLTKQSGTDYEATWADAAGGGGPTKQATAAEDMAAGAIVRVVMESGATAPTVRASAPGTGGVTIAVGVLAAAVTTGNTATVQLGVIATDAAATLTAGGPAYLDATNNLTTNPLHLPAGTALSPTSALLTYRYPRPDEVYFTTDNATYWDEDGNQQQGSLQTFVQSFVFDPAFPVEFDYPNNQGASIRPPVPADAFSTLGEGDTINAATPGYSHLLTSINPGVPARYTLDASYGGWGRAWRKTLFNGHDAAVEVVVSGAFGGVVARIVGDDGAGAPMLTIPVGGVLTVVPNPGNFKLYAWGDLA